jgi:hypothetical protein
MESNSYKKDLHHNFVQFLAWGCDWAHHTSIDGGVPTGDDPGKRWRRGRGGAPAAARVPAKLGAGKLNARPWELEGDLGKG